MKTIVSAAAKGDTIKFEQLIAKPGGRKFLEASILILLQQLPSSVEQKSEHFRSFLKIVQQLEEKISHRNYGEKILKEVLS